MTTGEKIKELRLERGMTLEQVGDIVGVGKSTVRKWECGQIQDIGRSKIVALCVALGTTPNYLFDWKKEEPARKIESPERAEVIKLFSKLDLENQKRLLDYAQVLLKSQQAETDSQV